MEAGKKNKRERGREGRGEEDGNKGSKSFRIHYAQALWLSIKPSPTAPAAELQ